MENRLTALQNEKTDLQRRLAARKDQPAYRMNCAAIEKRLGELDQQIVANGG